MENQKLVSFPESQNEAIMLLEGQSEDLQVVQANNWFNHLLSEASQPKSVSGNACVRLCGFVELCSTSKSESVRLWAFSREVTLRLFTFYIEWNESEQHRAMKLVLDLIVQLRKNNPDQNAADETEKLLLENLLSTVFGTSTKPVVKSAIKTLDHFLTKRILSLNDLKESFILLRSESVFRDDIDKWKHIFAALFHWMRIHFICAAAGKLFVGLYCTLRKREESQTIGLTPELLHEWLLEFLAEDSSLLEPTKNYILLVLFKADRPESLAFLRQVSRSEAVVSAQEYDVSNEALLQLTALEVGKRVGLVEEPALSNDEDTDREESPIILRQTTLDSVLAHPNQEVRSLAFSLLITSSSAIRPFSSAAFDLLRHHLGSFFAHADTKLRMELLSNVRDMFKRVRGAICVLKRSIPRARAKEAKKKQPVADTEAHQPILYRANLISLPEAQLAQCLEYHEKFLRWYLAFLLDELVPTASYQRHIGSLRSLTTILRIESEAKKPWETADDQGLFFDLFSKDWVRALYDLTLDPFEDVRDASATALRMFYSEPRFRHFSLTGNRDDESSLRELSKLSQKADQLARYTSRADHSDGGARICQLVYISSGEGQQRMSMLEHLISELEEKITVAEKDLGRAVQEAPLHGNFATLCYVWQVVSSLKFADGELESTRSLQERLVVSCERVWEAVRDVLCDDSPEGHLPQGLEELEGLDTKDLLSFSFRSVHESSNLLRAVMVTIRNIATPGSIALTSELFERAGNLSFTQLAALRHRGAFSTVSATFATCCQLTRHLGSALGSGNESLLTKWYKGTMNAIYAQASTTRRSAGIPSMITGILSANSTEPAFEDVMNRLMEISNIEARVSETDGSNLPQVHAFNCLKDIFKSSILASQGNKAEKFLSQCLELAANGLRSEVWAIRNCGLLLLRSLIRCLFGSQESKSMIEAGWDGKANLIAYYRYSTLPTVLLNLLRSGHQIMERTGTGFAGAESVFPALDIIRRAGPPELLRDELQEHVIVYLASPVWHVREMAARTLCSCLLHDKWLVTIDSILRQALDNKSANSQNHVHGALLALKFVFERLNEVAPKQIRGDLPTLITIFKPHEIATRFASSPEIMAAYLEVVNLLLAYQASHSQPLETFDVKTRSDCRSALLNIQSSINNIIMAYQGDDTVGTLEALFLSSTGNANTFIPALETLSTIGFKVPSIDANDTAKFCHMYLEVCLEETSPIDLRVYCLIELTTSIDRLLREKELSLLDPALLKLLLARLPTLRLNPSLANQIIRISGCVIAYLRQAQQISAQNVQAWGNMMASAIHEDEAFETRFAAAESLQSFFASISPDCSTEEHLPAILALYDILNDDDDEVRDVGSIATSYILNRILVPIKAANSLLAWLSQTTLKDSPKFRAILATRLIGYSNGRNKDPWHPAEEQLDAAMKVDDSLFAIEEQNLFSDDVRETRCWTNVFNSIQWVITDDTAVKLDKWLCRGLARLQEIWEMDNGDGPLSWSSSPQAFSILARIIIPSKALVGSNYASAELQGAWSKLKSSKAGTNMEESGIIYRLTRV